MTTTTKGTVILAQAEHYQEMLLSSAILSMNLAVRKVRRDLPLLHEIKAIRDSTRGHVVVFADLARIAQERMLWPQFTAALSEIVGNVGLMANQSNLLNISSTVRAWAMKHGAYDLMGRVSHIRVDSSMRPLLDAMRHFFGIEPDLVRVNEYLTGMHGTLDADADSVAVFQKTWRRLEGAGQSPTLIAEDMKAAASIVSQDRRYRLVVYPNCFLGTEAVDWLADHLSISDTQAEDVGNLLMKMGHFYHVAKDQPFKNEKFFYRFSAPNSLLNNLDLDLIMQESRELRGFDVQDRTWRGMRFVKCFVGAEAAKWMSAFYGLGKEGAIALGQSLHDIYHFRHVVDERDFIDHDFFYRMTMDN
jgi:Domain found in Dishevelled, Egl-10, and Pleckstrin (DEP)